MSEYELKVTPRRHGVSAIGAGEGDVLIRLQAPDDPPVGVAQRQHALGLACVIDRSGSMAGPPLDEAKRCVVHMIESLKPHDRAAIVVYDNDVRVLVPSTPMDDAGPFRTALAGVDAGGTTNLHGGWLKGAELLAGVPREDEIARVILLSDGNANVGLTDAAVIAAQCEELAAAGITTSTYGLGRKFNEDLMIAMAEQGGGNHYYGETAADLIEPFREEFELLQDLCARHVRLRLAPAPGVKARVMNDYPLAAPETYRLPDVAYGSEAWALVRLQLAEGALAGVEPGGSRRLLEIEVELVDTVSRERRYLQGALRLPVLRDEVLNALPQDELVSTRARELESAELHMRIRAAVRAGDWQTAERLLAWAEQETASHPWLQEMVRTVRELMARRDTDALVKEAAYASSRMRRRLAGKGEADALGYDLAAEREKRSFLRRKSQQGRRQFGDGDGAGRNR